MEEELVEQIADGHQASELAPRLKLALQLADAFFAADGPPTADVQVALQAEFTEAELVEMGIGLALFHGVAKMLISLGCEPEQMDIGIHRTPGT